MVAMVSLVGLMSCSSSIRSDPSQEDCGSGFTYLSDRCGVCPAPNMQPPGEAGDPTQKGMELIKTSLSLAKPPPVYFILLFSFNHTTLHWLPLPILPTVDCFGGAPSTTAVVHTLLFRPVSSGEPGLKHHQLADWVQASLISEIVQMGQIPKPP